MSSLLQLPFEIIESLISCLEKKELIGLDQVCRQFYSIILVKYRKFFSNDTISIPSWSELFQPFILLTAGARGFLFDLSSHTFKDYSVMQEHRFTRYYYGMVSTSVHNGRGAISISSASKDRVGTIEKLNFVSGQWSTMACSPIQQLSGYSGK
jgi:hypothetical protein